MRKKKIIFYILLILFFILLVVLSFLAIREMEKRLSSSIAMDNVYSFTSTSPFSINKIVYFSSANANIEINSNSSFTISNLYQYTDIALFINNHADGNFTAENTLKSVNLSDIQFSLSPSVGTPNLYFKNLNDFTTSQYDEANKIENTLDFTTSAEDEIDYSQPILYNNCANPITLCYVNSNIKSDYTLTDAISNISYDGSLLKNCSITLNSIACKLSFLITITNHLDEKFTCPVILTIPLSTENSTVYDGNLIVNDSTNYNFVKQQS